MEPTSATCNCIAAAWGATAGCIAAVEVVKLLTGVGTPLAGWMLRLDLGSGQARRLRLARDPACPVCAVCPLPPAVKTKVDTLEAVDFDVIAGWREDKLNEAWGAFRASCQALRTRAGWQVYYLFLLRTCARYVYSMIDRAQGFGQSHPPRYHIS
jgi:hypothetical protein